MQNDKAIVFVCDPVLSEYGPLRPAMLIARRMLKNGKQIVMVSTTFSSKLQKKLNSMGILTINLRKELILKKNESMAWLEAWIREAVFSMNSRSINKFNGIILNFSNTICLPAHVWYAQGPPTVTLDNIKEQLPLHFKLIYLVLSPFFRIVDKNFTRKNARCSIYILANSKYLASIYSKFGVPVNGIIYPPLNCEKFKPKTASPSEDFILTYFGKEIIFNLLKNVLDLGIKVKAFGSKLSLVPRKLRKHPNLDFLGRIEDEELIDLYSNALFTFYPFSDEPFGYIPIESLACGTPVLTFNKQGPKETVIDEETGWLANSDSELLKLALRIWKTGYSKNVRKKCRQRAMAFDVDTIVKDWLKLINYFSV